MACHDHEDRTIVKKCSEFYGLEKTNTLSTPEHEVRLVLDDICANVERSAMSHRWRDGMNRMKRGAVVEKDFNNLEEVIDDIFSDEMSYDEMLEMERIMESLNLGSWSLDSETIVEEDIVFQGESEDLPLDVSRGLDEVFKYELRCCGLKEYYHKARDLDSVQCFMKSLSDSMELPDIYETLHMGNPLRSHQMRMAVNDLHDFRFLNTCESHETVPEFDEIELVRDYVVNERHLKKHKYEADVVALGEFLKELDEEHDEDIVLHGESLDEYVDMHTVLSFVDTTNIVVNTIHEIYEIICTDGSVNISKDYWVEDNKISLHGRPKKFYKVYTKLSILYRVLTGKSLTDKVYHNFLHGLVKSFVKRWLKVNCDVNEDDDDLVGRCDECGARFDQDCNCDELRHANKQPDLRVKAESLEEYVRVANEKTKDGLSLFESDFGQKLATFCSLLICVPFINSMGITPTTFGADKMTEYLYKKNYAKKGMSVPLVLLETSTAIFLKITEVMRVGSSALFITQEDHIKAEREYAWLKRNHTNFSCCTEVLDENGKPDKFTLDDYAHRCSVALQLYDHIIPSLKKHPYAFMRAEKHKSEINDFQNDCYAELRANVSRDQPYGVMLCGDPGLGKSAIQDITLRVLHAADNATGRFNIPYNVNLKYTYPPNDKFYSGFSTSHTSLIIDDVAQKNADIMVALGGDDIVDIIRCVNTQPFCPEQAELHKKGKVPMRVRYVIGTTNTEDLHAQYIFSYVSAIYRRFIFVRCEVKPQYRQEFGNGLHGDDANPQNMDLWNFTIIRHFPVGKTTVQKYLNPRKTQLTGKFVWDANQSIHTVCDMSDYSNFLRNHVEVHWKNQDKATRVADVLDEATLCECGIPVNLCGGKCWKAQGLVDVVVSYTTGSWMMGDYVFALLLFSFLPTWFMSAFSILLYSLMPRSMTPSGIFPSLFTACQSMILPIFIIPCLTHNMLCERWWPSKPSATVKPRWSVRTAMYLIPKMPKRSAMHDITKFVRPVWKIFGVKRDEAPNGLCSDYYLAWLERTLYKDPKEAYNFFRQHVITDWKFQSCVIFILVIKMARRLLRVKETFEGHALQEAMPVPDKYELATRSQWTKDNGIGEFPSVGRTVTEYTFKNEAMLNTVLLVFDCTTMRVRCNGFIIKGNLLVTPAHSLCDLVPVSVTMRRLHKNGKYVDVLMLLDKTVMWTNVAKDLLFIKHNMILPGRNMYKFLASSKTPPTINSSATLQYVDPADGVHKEVVMSRVAENTTVHHFYHRDKQYTLSDTLLATCETPTKEGLCGAPVLVTQGIERCISSIHCAGGSNSKKIVALSTKLFREDVDAAMLNLGGFVLPDDADNDIAFSMNGEAMRILEVHPKCVTNKLFGEYHTIGGSALPRARPRTNVCATPFAKDVLKYYSRNTRFNEITHVSPIHCDEKIATLVAMEPAVKNSSFYPAEVRFAVNCLTWEILQSLSPERLARMKPVPWSVAINGRDGIPYLDRINLNTSGGYGHSGPKKRFFALLPPTLEHAVNYTMTPDLTAEVEYIMEQYNKGEEANPVFKCSFKDEPITKEKEKANKVRVFSGSPVAFSIVARRYYLCFIRECVGRHRLDFEMAIGANAHGYDWGLIYDRVTRHGHDRCFAGDFKAFDKQMSPELIIAAFSVILNIYEAAGWSEEDLRVARGIATDTAFPTTDLFGTLIQLYGANPSGHILTTPINSIVNSLYFRLAVGRILNESGYELYTEMDPGLTPGGVNMTRFKDILSLVTYGDDNCGSISPKYPCITHTSIQEALGLAGIVYTMDKKDAESVDYVDASTITFLKRHFVVQKDGRVLAPLLEESLFKSLTVWTKSKSICTKEQMACVLSSVNREYFFYGPVIFEKRRNFLIELVNQYGLEEYLPGGGLEEYHEIYDSLDWAVPAP